MSTALEKFIFINGDQKKEQAFLRRRQRYKNSLQKAKDFTTSQQMKKKLYEKKIERREKTSMSKIESSRKNILQSKCLYLKMRSYQPIRLLKNSSLPSCLDLPSAITKPALKYQNQLNNLKMIENIISMKPSQQLCFRQHKKFFQKHLQYSNHMRMSPFHKSAPIKEKKQQWVN